MNLWQANPIEWFNALSHLAAWLIPFDILMVLAVAKSTASPRLFTLNTWLYGAALIGWLVMRWGISLSAMSALVTVSIIGWLLLLPALCGIAINACRKLAMPKNALGVQLGNACGIALSLLAKAGKAMVILCSLLVVILLKGAGRKPPSRIFANPLNESNPNTEQLFPNEWHESQLDIVE